MPHNAVTSVVACVALTSTSHVGIRNARSGEVMSDTVLGRDILNVCGPKCDHSAARRDCTLNSRRHRAGHEKAD